MVKVLRLLTANSSKLKASGFTLIEVLVSVAIVGLIATISVASFSTFEKKEALETDTGKVLALLAEARTQTLSAKDGAYFGVHFEATRAVLFKGGTYSAGSADNQAHPFDDEVTLASTTLSGGGSEVIFKRLTGATSQSGTITLASVRDAGTTRIITIAGTGVAYSN